MFDIPWRILTVLVYMVCHGSHQYTLVMLALIYQHQPDPSLVCLKAHVTIRQWNVWSWRIQVAGPHVMNRGNWGAAKMAAMPGQICKEQPPNHLIINIISHYSPFIFHSYPVNDSWWWFPYAPWCWNIYQHLPQTWPSYVVKYSSTMGCIWGWWLVFRPFQCHRCQPTFNSVNQLLSATYGDVPSRKVLGSDQDMTPFMTRQSKFIWRIW